MPGPTSRGALRACSLLAFSLWTAAPAHAALLERDARAVAVELAWTWSGGRARPHALRLGVVHHWMIGDQCTYWRRTDCVTAQERPGMVFPLVGVQAAAEWRGGNHLDLLVGPRTGFGFTEHGDMGFSTHWSVEGEVEGGVAFHEGEPRLRLAGRGMTVLPPCLRPSGEQGLQTTCQSWWPTILARVGWEALQPGPRTGLLLGAGTQMQVSSVGTYN